MNILDIINKKRLNNSLSYSELDYAFNSYLKGIIPDYQMSSLLMAICINGMDDNEVFDLVDIFIKSGETLDLSSIEGIKVDKHSTGGIGDKITLIIAPIVSSCGVIVPKMSGRGLGITGGTIDKLESIPGFNISLSNEEFKKELEDLGMAITGQTSSLCPLDKVIYALRDVTGTTESIPLIAASIMSKKIAGGADKIFIDLKCGTGALIKDIEDAKKLKQIMESIGKKYNKETICEISDMNTPLGNNIGNSLEVMEAIDILNGKQGNLTNLAIKISSEMISSAKNISLKDAKSEVVEVIKNKKALQKFYDFVKYQHGDISKLKVSSHKQEIKSQKDGVVKSINALNIGRLSCSLGAGRLTKTDKIDYTVGIIINKQLGYKVKEGDTLMTLCKKDDSVISIDISEYFNID